MSFNAPPSGHGSPLTRALLGPLAAVLLVAPPALQAAQIHALVIGIDHYQRQQGTLDDLEGAVNDARDIAAALEDLDADVTLLIDESAQRQAIWAAWERMVQRAQAGDTLWVSYAGHGGQLPARPGSQPPEDDALDEVLFLGGYRAEGPGGDELIVDDEWHRRIAAVETQGIDVILVLDSCYSGTGNRDFVPGRWRATRHGG
ncbi:MAG: caspase family protein, partial [Candidatus Competibacterales bacterium]